MIQQIKADICSISAETQINSGRILGVGACLNYLCKCLPSHSGCPLERQNPFLILFFLQLLKVKSTIVIFTFNNYVFYIQKLWKVNLQSRNLTTGSIFFTKRKAAFSLLHRRKSDFYLINIRIRSYNHSLMKASISAACSSRLCNNLN